MIAWSPKRYLNDAPPAAGPPPARAGASAQALDSDSVRQAAEGNEGFKLLLGGDAWSTRDFNAQNKSEGEPVALLAEKTELRVTPTHVTTGTVACAGGPATTVELLVERVSGPADLVPGTFAVLSSDGSTAAPVQGCSTGFAEASTQRTLVFAGTDPDRLIIGSNPARPVVTWQLS